MCVCVCVCVKEKTRERENEREREREREQQVSERGPGECGAKTFSRRILLDPTHWRMEERINFLRATSRGGFAPRLKAQKTTQNGCCRAGVVPNPEFTPRNTTTGVFKFWRLALAGPKETRSGIFYSPFHPRVVCQQVSAGISRYQQVSAGISRYQQVSAGISRCQQVSAGIGRCQQVSTGISKCQQVSAGISNYVAWIKIVIQLTSSWITWPGSRS